MHFLNRYCINRSVLGLLVLIPLLLFFIFPLFSILYQAFLSQAGQLSLNPFIDTLFDARMGQLVINSIKVACTTTLLVVCTAFALACAITQTRIKGKSLFKGIALIPLLAPSLLPGIALIYLFGNQGIFKSLLPDTMSIYGFWGIVLGEFFYTLPHALLIILSSLLMLDGRLYDAANSLNASPLKRFYTIVFMQVRLPLIAATFVVFTLTITDFGVPKLVGGNYSVLATEAYIYVIGQQDFQRGAVIGLLLLMPALLSFTIDRYLMKKHTINNHKAIRYQPPKNRLRDAFGYAISIGLALFILTILGVAILASLVAFWPYNLSFTLNHFNFDHVDGGGWKAFYNSIYLAVCVSTIGISLIFFGAYVQNKLNINSFLKNTIAAFTLLPMATPGMVLGLGYIFFFNHQSNPLHGLYGGMGLLMMCTVMHFYTTAHLSLSTALLQLDHEYEAIGASLGVPLWRTIIRVSIPLSLPVIIDTARYLFVSALTTVSAVIFLYSPDTILASVSILNMEDAGDTAAAAAMACLITLTAALGALLFSCLAKCFKDRSH